MSHTNQPRPAAGLFALLCAVSIAAPSISLAEPCGTVVTAGSTLTLSSDVGPCDGTLADSAIEVQDGGTLDLNGKTVTCQDINTDTQYPVGIRLLGSKDHVSNGTVDGCMIGVVLSGDGRHAVESVTATNSHDDGFVIETALGNTKNRLTSCTASDNAVDGFSIGSDKNSLTSTSATGNGAAGYDVIGAKNKFFEAVASGNSGAGFGLTGTGNKLTGGSASSNGDGVACNGEGCTIKEMTIASNTGDGIGIGASAASVKVLENTVSNNAYGIRVQSSAVKVKVIRNNSSLNSTRDMTDELAGCGDHKWVDNTFATSNDACIQ